MRHLSLMLVVLLLFPAWGRAENYAAIFSYEPDVSWIDDGSSSWLNLDIDGVIAPRRIAVGFSANGVEIIRTWDNPSARTLPFAVSAPMTGPRAKIVGHTYAYEGGPWRSATAFAVGDRLAVGGIDATTGLEAPPTASVWWQCNRAGTSGASRPDFHGYRKFLQPDYYRLAASGAIPITGSAVDNGDGTVTLTVGNAAMPEHGFKAGDEVRINGTTNYDGVSILPAQTGGDVTHVVITAAYAEETFDGTESIWLTSGGAVDLGGGLVSIPATAHGLAAGDVVRLSGTQYYTPSSLLVTGAAVDLGGGLVGINTTTAHGLVEGRAALVSGTVNYDGVHVLPSQALGDADTIVISAAAYTAETFEEGADLVQPLHVLPSQSLGDGDHVVILSAFAHEGFSWDDSVQVMTGRTTDLGGGLVSLSVPGHGFAAGETVSINGSPGYAGVQVLPAQTLGDADHLVISAAYAEEYHHGQESVTRAIEDPDGAGAQWALMIDFDNPQTVLEAEPTGRIIVQRPASGNLITERSGTNFTIGSGP